jgi:hypothetical protein
VPLEEQFRKSSFSRQNKVISCFSAAFFVSDTALLHSTGSLRSDLVFV